MTKKTLSAACCLALLLSLALALAASCEKEPANSDIEGFWRLEKFTTKADGVTTRPERLFLSIQLWVVRLGNHTTQTTPDGSADTTGGDPSEAGTYVGRYAWDEAKGTVRMWDFFPAPADSLTEEEKEALEKADTDKLAPYGIGALDTTFRVVKADGHHLELESDYATLYLTRF